MLQPVKLALWFCLAGGLSGSGVGSTPAGPGLTILSSTLARGEGLDSASGTAYTRIYLLEEDAGGTMSFDRTRPALTVECTQRVDGKYGFSLGLNFSGVVDAAWRPKQNRGAGTPHADRRDDQRDVLIEYFGYTRVKPYKRQFMLVSDPLGALEYNPPGMHSSNLDDAAYHLQYLRALPTLRLTYEGRSATFDTEPLLTQIRQEPLCRASHL